jgi:hypothetical protein
MQSRFFNLSFQWQNANDKMLAFCLTWHSTQNQRHFSHSVYWHCQHMHFGSFQRWSVGILTFGNSEWCLRVINIMGNATPVCIVTFGIARFNITMKNSTLNITMLGITTLSIPSHYADCWYAECCIFIVMLSAIMLNVAFLLLCWVSSCWMLHFYCYAGCHHATSCAAGGGWVGGGSVP